MKVIFKIAAIQVALAAALALAGPAQAAIYWQPPDLLKDFFPGATAFEKVPVDWQAKAAQVRERLGYAPERPAYVFYRAEAAGKVLGWAFFDNEVGQHEPITFGVKLDPAGHVVRQEILAYREPRGDEVRAEAFRRQFYGKGPTDAIRLGDDIRGVAGATYSSRAMAKGVKRAVQLFDLFLRPGA